MRMFARRLMAYEAGESKSAAAKTPPAFRVCEKLHAHMTTFMGNAGFRSLLARALALATPENPWLRAVHVAADGSVERLPELQAQLEPSAFFKGGVDLLAELLGLLVTFIGERLTLRLVREIWPKVQINDSVFDNGEKKEIGV
jgi:hypothetical protein